MFDKSTSTVGVGRRSGRFSLSLPGERGTLFGVNVEIINTGSELMLGFVLNTHQQWLCRELSNLGHVVSRQIAVNDSGPDIQQAVRESVARAPLVITTGGLGPTSDDITRDLVAQLLGKELREDKSVLAHIESFFAGRKRPMPVSTRVQAMVPDGAEVLQNAHGTAPGLAMPTPGGLLVMLPGPPRELRPMFTNQVVPLLARTFPKAPDFVCRVFKTTGIGESMVEERIAPDLAGLVAEGLEIGYCARVGEVDVRLVGRGPSAGRLVAAAEECVRAKLSQQIVSDSGGALDSVIVDLLTRRGQTLALAESCTGGYIANRLTNIPGASAALLAGLVTYSNESKSAFLGVRPETIQAHGAVSEATAREMAEGARAKTGADFGISVTGIAGPSGGSPEKPVGTVYMALATRHGTVTDCRRNQYDRETFKYVTSQQALEMLRQHCLKHAP